MKYLLVFPFCLLLSCNTKPTIQPPLTHNNTPKALEEPESENDISSLKRLYKESDLLDEIFKEISEKDQEYKTLLAQISVAYEMQNDSLKEFNNYNEKSVNYYTSAKNKTNSIKDTILKQRIVKLIENSNNLYINNIAGTQKLVNQVGSNSSSITDLLTVLKITSTISYIEKYQDKQAGKKPIKELIKQQEEILKKLNALNKKNGF